MRGIGVTGLLGVLFIAFKLAHIIDWSWFWVLCPFWIGIALVLGFFLIAVIGFISKEGISAYLNKRRMMKRKKRFAR